MSPSSSQNNKKNCKIMLNFNMSPLHVLSSRIIQTCKPGVNLLFNCNIIQTCDPGVSLLFHCRLEHFNTQPKLQFKKKHV